MCTMQHSTVQEFASNVYGCIVKIPSRLSECAIDAVASSVSHRSRGSQSLSREAVTWKCLAHPNVVPLLGVVVTSFQLVSIWMPGGTLQEYIKEHPDADRVRLVGSPPIVIRPH